MTELEKILADLVAIPSVTGQRQSSRQLLDYVREFLEAYNLDCQYLADETYDLLVATTQPGNKEPDVLLLAHGDVVPADPASFKLTVDGSKLGGRGVWDMKFAIAAYLEMVRQLGAQVTDFNIGIAITTDEETRNLNVAYLLKQGYRPKCVVLPDGANNWQLESAAKGAWTVKVTTRGKSAHGAQPWKGESASFKLLDLLQEVRALFPDQGPKTDTLNISLLDGGIAANQIPDSASAHLDIRAVSNENLAIIQDKLVRLCNAYQAEWKITADIPVLEHDITDRYMKAFTAAVAEVTHAEAGYSISYGASEAGYFINEQIPCIVTRPTGGGHHSDIEWVDRKSLSLFPDILQRYLAAVAQL